MVLRNDSEDEREHLLDNIEDNISEESISSVYGYKNILVGEPELHMKQSRTIQTFIFRCGPVPTVWGSIYSKQFYYQPVSSYCQRCCPCQMYHSDQYLYNHNFCSQ